MTTELARNKAVLEIAPRYKDAHFGYTRIKVLTTKRLGDNSKMAYIEYMGNELEKYEKSYK